ncbi:YfiR family protein [Sphingomonas sp. MMS24-J13]|uniref:YfiR family protein n=1 Tax=Sphingomonas sp. MMS24-J13 TaxID=3238686 RepID=UPI00384D6F1C
MAIVRRLMRTALAIGAASSVSVAAAAQSPETIVKANYLTKFALFIDWPARSFAAPDSPFRICVSGTDPFGAALADAVKGQQVQGHPVTIEHPDAATMGQCHILFVGPGSESPPAEIIHTMHGHPVLTVTDNDQDFPGSIIAFMTLDGRVRFAVDAAAAEQSGLQISSKLLELAVKVAR